MPRKFELTLALQLVLSQSPTVWLKGSLRQ